MAGQPKPRPTVRPAVSFDAGTDAANLKKAMKGLGTDEKLIIQVLARRPWSQRQQIQQNFQQQYQKDLMAELKKELSGDLAAAVAALMTPPAVFLAQELHRAMKGLGTDEQTLVEVLCSKSNAEIAAIKKAYQELYGKPLEDSLKAETSGDFGKLVLGLAAARRDEAASLDPAAAASLAQGLYKAGEKKLGTDEAEFIRVLTSYSLPQLRIVFGEYAKIGGTAFDAALRSELSGDFRNAALALFECASGPAAFFAGRLRNAMKGAGTREGDLIRIAVTRCEHDLGSIKDEFAKAFGKSLEDAVAAETSGDFKKILLTLMQD